MKKAKESFKKRLQELKNRRYQQADAILAVFKDSDYSAKSKRRDDHVEIEIRRDDFILAHFFLNYQYSSGIKRQFYTDLGRDGKGRTKYAGSISVCKGYEKRLLRRSDKEFLQFMAAKVKQEESKKEEKKNKERARRALRRSETIKSIGFKMYERYGVAYVAIIDKDPKTLKERKTTLHYEDKDGQLVWLLGSSWSGVPWLSSTKMRKIIEIIHSR